MNTATSIADNSFSIVLLRPEIPHNTGAIGRLCVGLGVPLHLVKPLGFALDAWDFSKFREVVFCGYGEPTERLDVLLAAAAHLKAKPDAPKIRVNTNGLSDLIWGRDTAPDFVGKVDTLSISLNTDDPAEYLAVCRPKFGAAAYPAMKHFAQNAARLGIDVVMTIVDSPVTTPAQQENCRRICEELGARLRIRPYESK